MPKLLTRHEREHERALKHSFTAWHDTHPLAFHHPQERGISPLPHEGSHTQGQDIHHAPSVKARRPKRAASAGLLPTVDFGD
jgi:hypothetical protein